MVGLRDSDSPRNHCMKPGSTGLFGWSGHLTGKCFSEPGSQKDSPEKLISHVEAGSIVKRGKNQERAKRVKAYIRITISLPLNSV